MEKSQYDTALLNAQKSVKKFADQNLSLNGVLTNVTGTVGKMAAGVGVAMTATEAFNKVMRSSQTTSDAWDRAMRAATTTVNEFFTAISTGDFSTMLAGLDEIVAKAMEAQMALDQLGNTTISYRYFTAKNTAEFQEQLAILKDADSTEQERLEAQEKMKKILEKQKGITEQFGIKSQNAVNALVVEGNRLDASMITQEDIENVIEQDVKAAGDKQKAEWAKQYEEYRKQVAIITNKNTKWETVGYGFNARPVRSVDTEAIEKELAPLNKQYLTAIAYNEILVKKSDDWLDNLTHISQQAFNANQSLATMQRTYSRATKGMNSSSSGATAKSIATATAATKWVEPETITDENGSTVNKRLYEGLKSSEKYKDKEPVVTELEFLEGTQQYQTELGKKVMNYLQGGENIVVPITMETQQDTDEPDLATDAESARLKRLKKEQEAAAALQKQLQGVSRAFSAMSSAASSFGQDGIAAVLTSMGAITEMVGELKALAAAEAVEGASKLPFPASIPAIATALATVISAFTSIGNFAEGGIVPGSNFQDGIVARVSSGEMFINQADQKKLYDQIHSGQTGGGGTTRSVITGEQIVTVVNNHFRRIGRGEVLK